MQQNNHPKIVFIVSTELQLLNSLSFYYAFYENKQAIPVFYLFKSSDNRFKSINSQLLPGKSKIIKNNLDSLNFKKGVRLINTITEIQKTKNISALVFSNVPSIFNSSLRKYFESEPVKKILLTDGLSLYIEWGLRTRLTYCIKAYFRKVYNKISGIGFKYLFNPNYLDDVDLVISTKEIPSKETILIERIYNKVNIKQLRTVFNITEEEVNLANNANVIFFGQPRIKGGINNEAYMKILQMIINATCKENKKLLIKPHPAEDYSIYKKYISKNVVVSTGNYPAELLLWGTNNRKLIISIFSSISMSDLSKNNLHIWLCDFLQLNITNEFRHIKRPKSKIEIEQYIKEI